jgi:hypothetical protein
VKHCNGCDQDLPVEQFHRHARTKDGLQARCKACQRASTYAWRENNPERTSAITKRSYAKVGRDRQYRRLYGLSESEVEEMADAQGRRCAICRRHESESVNGLHLDHDHATGGIRGLLCQQCNTALGKFNDDRAALATAILYLDRYEASKP